MKEDNSTQQNQVNQSQNQAAAQKEQNDINRKRQQQAFDTKLMNFFGEEFYERKLEIALKYIIIFLQKLL